MRIDEILPEYDAVERHAVAVRASRARTWQALRAADLGGSRLAAALLALRGLGRASCRESWTVDGLVDSGFTILAEEPGEEIVLGLVGKFWRPSGAVQRLDPAAFAAFDEPGWARAAWSFSLADGDPGVTRLATETRVRCTDPASRRRFRAYWLLVRPFSGIVRREALRLVQREAENPASAGS